LRLSGPCPRTLPEAYTEKVQARPSIALALVASSALHVWAGSTLRAAASALASPYAPRAPDAPAPFEAVSRDPSPVRQAAAEPPLPGAPQRLANVDTDAQEGASALRAGGLVWIEALPRPDELTLRDADLNSAEASQLQRIATAPLRESPEWRRATPNPAADVFVASGERGPRERVTRGPRWPREGAPRAEGLPSHPASGPAPSGERAPPELAPTLTAAAEVAPDAPSRGPGGAGSDGIAHGLVAPRHGAAALSAPRDFARPAVDEGLAAAAASVFAPRPNDRDDAELLAAQLARSMVDATRTRALRDEAGEGARAAGGVGLASAGTGQGSQATPLKPGPGQLGVLDVRDARYLRWFGDQRARVAERLRFPQRRALMMDQGESLIAVSVARSGVFASAPRVYRTSGFADFDAAALRAVAETGQFAPLPPEILPGAEVLSLLVPVRFFNPMVR
jgi:TonB family protein